ncbi:MAG: insulinase family protein, partial [Patescibacteria group bacterium]
EKYFENIRKANKLTKLAVKEEQSLPQLKLHYKKTDQSHFILGFRGYDMFDEERYAAGVLATVLGGGMSSRLFTEIRDKRGLAYYVSADSDSYTDTGIFAMNAGVNNDKADDAIKVMLEEVEKIKNKGVTARELQQAKDQAEGVLAIALENSRAVANVYAGPILFYDKVLTPEEELDKIKKVTLDDISKVANEVFVNGKMNLAMIGPFEKEDEFKKLLSF